MKKSDIEASLLRIIRLFRFIPDDEDIIDVLCEALCKSPEVWRGLNVNYKDVGRDEKMMMRSCIVRQLQQLEDLATGCENLTESIRETVLSQ
jgi:hypothetical protein